MFLIPVSINGQTEKYPIFNECKSKTIDQLPKCFSTETKLVFYKHFKTPEIVKKDKFKGSVKSVFIVNNLGEFKLVYVNSPYQELRDEIERVFKNFPVITPAKYNNVSVEMQFTLPINFPLEPFKNDDVEAKPIIAKDLGKVVKEKKEKFTKNKYNQNSSHLNIPFHHQRYVDYEKALHQNSETHTAVKPYIFREVILIIT